MLCLTSSANFIIHYQLIITGFTHAYFGNYAQLASFK